MYFVCLNNQLVKRPTSRSVLLSKNSAMKRRQPWDPAVQPALFWGWMFTQTEGGDCRGFIPLFLYSNPRYECTSGLQTRHDMKALYDFVSRYTWLKLPLRPTDSTRMCSPSSRRHVPVAPPAGLLAIAGVGIVLTVTTKTIGRSQAELMNPSNCVSLV